MSATTAQGAPQGAPAGPVGPEWATVPVTEQVTAAVRDLDRLGVPWHWERGTYPKGDTTEVVYATLRADVGTLPGAAPLGHVPVHTRKDASYAFGLFQAVRRQAEPVQMTLDDVLGAAA